MIEKTTTTFAGDLTGLSNRINFYERLTPEFYRQEVDKVYRRGWLLVACASDIPNPNDFVAREVPPLNTCLIVARGADGEVRAFHNMCRHRGNRLVTDGEGNARKFTCGFHGWTYFNDGRLAAVTDRTQFKGIDEEELGLVPVHTEVWEDFVFVNFDKEPRMTLREWMDTWHDGFRGYFNGRQKVANQTIDLNCNWNVVMNAFSEGYHALFVHRATVPDYQGGPQNPERHRPYIGVSKNHGLYSVEGSLDHKPTRVEGIAYGRGRPMYPTFTPNITADRDLPPGVNPLRIRNWLHDIIEIFPNIYIVAAGDFHTVGWFWPIDENRTHVTIDYYAYEAESVDDHMAHAYFRTILREVFREDVSVMENVHRQFKSGAMTDIHLSQQELLLQKHFSVVDRMVSQP